MSNETCGSCRLPKTQFECEICHLPQCKRCVQILAKDSFLLMEEVPKDLTHRYYCGPCYESKVGPSLQEYQELEAKAKEVFIFYKSKSEATRLMSRAEKPIRVKDCLDEENTLMRMAFIAAKKDFNAIIDVVLSSEKVRNAGYQTTRWHGIGTPTRVDADRLNAETDEKRLI